MLNGFGGFDKIQFGPSKIFVISSSLKVPKFWCETIVGEFYSEIDV